MSTIAIFSTYAPSEQFGGPARIYHQRRILEAAGFDVTHVVIEATPTRWARRPIDHVELSERPFRDPLDHMYADVDLGRRAAATPKLLERVRAHLSEQQVAAVIMEQPFLVDVVTATTDSVPIIYSCQNIEYRLRHDLERYQFLFERPTNRADEVRDIEQRAIDVATAVTTICPTDRDKLLHEFGAESTIVPNGSTIADIPLPPQPPNHVADFVFAGSSYWPNVDGFASIAQPSLAFLPPTTRIQIMGSAADDLLNTPKMAKHHSINASRLDRRGFVPMDELVTAMRSTRAILVPVFIGEGSNLKSADALAAGSPVIMTQRATHGYEDIIDADPTGITICPDATSFRTAMTDTLTTPPPTNYVGNTRRHLLTWHTRLTPLLNVIHNTLHQ